MFTFQFLNDESAKWIFLTISPFDGHASRRSPPKKMSNINYLGCGIFGFCLLSFPQNERKIYKLRQTKLSQFVYFSLVLREREETKTKPW